MPTIGERLALIRQNAGLTMTAFAEKLNLSKSTISLAENNKQALSVRVIVDICEKFNIRREWLETGEGEMLQELRQYTSKDIYNTCRISLRDYVEKEPGTDYPLACFEIVLNSVANIHDVDSDAGGSKYNVAIVESCHSYAPVYADGHWADEYPNTARVRNWGKNRNITEVIEILCRNWDSIIAGAYEEIKLAYQKDTEKQLNEALEQEEKAITKHDALSVVKK